MSLTKQELEQLERGERIWGCGSNAAKVRAFPVRMLRSKAREVLCRATGKSMEATARTFWGAPMHVVYPDQVSMTIDRYGFFEPELARVMMGYLRPGMTFFDVGSHFGFFSLLALRLVGDTGRVVAFEPTPSTFRMVSKNLEGRPNARAVNVAAFSRNDELKFTDYGVAFSGFNTLGAGKMAAADKAGVRPVEIVVRALRLDDWVREHGVAPDFLKIDTEGAEPHVLAGLEGTLREHRPMVTLEMKDVTGEEATSRPLVDWMLARGYKALESDGKGVRPHTPLERYEYSNLLFVPA